jgi:hypothetical protein
VNFIGEKHGVHDASMTYIAMNTSSVLEDTIPGGEMYCIVYDNARMKRRKEIT